MFERLETFLTALYTIVDDIYKSECAHLLTSKPGAKPTFSDSEVITLHLAQQLCGFDPERAWLEFVRNNLLELFLDLISQSQFNRRVRNPAGIIHHLRRHLVCKLGAYLHPYRILDTKPIPVCRLALESSQSLLRSDDH